MNKDIVVIGNGKSVLNKENGKLIDSFETVVRFNFFHIKKYEKWVGTKTDIWFTTVFEKIRLKELNDNCKIIEHSWQWDEKLDKTYQKIKDFGVKDLSKTKREITREMQAILGDRSYHAFSTGAIALYMFSKEYEEISICGFDWWENNLTSEDKHHYADNYKLGRNHKPDKELQFIMNLSERCKIFNINTNSYIIKNKGTSSMDKNKKEWEDVHQPFELKYHQGANMRWNDNSFWEQWDKIFGEFMEYKKDEFKEGTVMFDVGCGSRPCLEWFDNSDQAHYEDPLMSEYQKIERMKPHWEDKLDRSYSKPAEELNEELVGKVDFLLCYNVLDHTFDWEQIVNNLERYLKKDGILCLFTDCGHKPHLGHPGIPDRPYFEKVIANKFEILKETKGFHHRTLGYKLKLK